jgi:hypothetical protein
MSLSTDASDDCTRDGGQTDLVLGIEQVSSADKRESADQRQFVVFEEVDLDAVRERDGFYFRDLDLA